MAVEAPPTSMAAGLTALVPEEVRPNPRGSGHEAPAERMSVTILEVTTALALRRGVKIR